MLGKKKETRDYDWLFPSLKYTSFIIGRLVSVNHVQKRKKKIKFTKAVSWVDFFFRVRVNPHYSLAITPCCCPVYKRSWWSKCTCQVQDWFRDQMVFQSAGNYSPINPCYPDCSEVPDWITQVYIVLPWFLVVDQEVEDRYIVLQ